MTAACDGTWSLFRGQMIGRRLREGLDIIVLKEDCVIC